MRLLFHPQPSVREFNLLVCQLVLTLDTIRPPDTSRHSLQPGTLSSLKKADFLAQSAAHVPQHAFVRSALEKANRGRDRARSRLSDRQRQQMLGADRALRDAPLETLESDEEQMASCGGTERDMDRVRRYLHEHCLDARLRLREALVVARLLGALHLEWPGTLVCVGLCCISL